MRSFFSVICLALPMVTMAQDGVTIPAVDQEAEVRTATLLRCIWYSSLQTTEWALASNISVSTAADLFRHEPQLQSYYPNG